MNKIICYLLMFLFLLSSIIYSQDFTSIWSGNFIILKNGKTLKGKVGFERKIGGDFLITFNDTLKLNIDDIKLMNNGKGTFATYHKIIKKNKNFRYKNIFLKRIKEGNVAVFSEYHPFIRNQNSELYQYYIMKSGNLMEVNYTNLKKSLFNNTQSAKMLEEYDFYKKLSEKLLWIGLSSTIYGILSERTGGELITYFGIVCTVGSSLPFFMKRNKLQKAIDIYNN